MQTASKVVVFNASAGDLVLPTGILVPSREGVAIAADVWDAVKAHPVVLAWGKEGRLSIVDAAPDDEPAAKPARKKG